jgi:hypothetical protein
MVQWTISSDERRELERAAGEARFTSYSALLLTPQNTSRLVGGGFRSYIRK